MRSRPDSKKSTSIGKRTATLMSLAESKPGATAHPMSASRGTTPNVVIYKVFAKMFAILSVRGDENIILKCDPNLAQALREEYAGVGHRSHLDKRFWISVDLNSDVPMAEIKRLLGHSYQLVCAGLTRKQQAELGGA